jgi:glycosyltransferase involved in cell wall biosynthesis
VKNVWLVTPVLNEGDGLDAYEAAVRGTLMASPDTEFRVLFVDDGSSDGSWGRIQEISTRDARFQGIRLSRNFGSHVAISAGLAHAQGDAVVILAADLQDPPEVVLEMVDKWKRGARIVWARRRSRAEGALRTGASRAFEWLLRRFALPKGSRFTTGSFLLADRQVVECLNLFGEHNRITFAIVAWTGFAQEVVEYDRKARTTGKSGWSFGQFLKVSYDAFIGFSLMPVRAITTLGVSVSLASLAMLAYLLFAWSTGNPLPGWTSQMAALSFFFGLQFLLTGIMGEYLYRIYAEAVRRPLYFISERTGEQDSGAPHDR